MSIRLKVNGVEYENFESASVDIRLDALCRAFSFTATATADQPLPFKGGAACEVIVDGELVLTGHIEVISVTYDSGSHSINVQGRDRTADLLDSTLGAIDDLRTDSFTLKQLIEAVIKSLGLSLTVIDEANPPPFNPAEDLAAPEAGDHAFDFIEKYSRKRQVLLTSNAYGNIVISKNTGRSAAGAVQHIIGAEDNNVLRSNFAYDITGRYRSYRVVSGMNPVALNEAGGTDLASLVDQAGGVSDLEIRAGRQLIIVSETAFASDNCGARAKWEADIRKARGLTYSASVSGFRVAGDTGALWQVNRVYQIVDDYIGKVEPMLCNSITFSYDLNSGSETALGFVRRNAYTLDLSDDPYATVASNVT